MEFWLAITITDGAWFGAGGLTVIGIVTELLSCESEAVSFNTYEPAMENIALVLGLVGFVKETVAGPLTCVHCEVTVAPAGWPSSVIVPVKLTVLAGSVRLTLSTETLIAGDWFGVEAASTVMVTCAAVENSVSVAVNCSV